MQGYTASGISRFHMPGHKGAAGGGWFRNSFPWTDFFAGDITEIQGADSLYEASGIIRESEENASFLFGTACTVYSTEGSSQCIRAMLALVTDMFPQRHFAAAPVSGQPDTAVFLDHMSSFPAHPITQPSTHSADPVPSRPVTQYFADLAGPASDRPVIQPSAHSAGPSFDRPVILAARNVHRSFITAAALLDLDVVWLYPEEDNCSLCTCKVSPEQVRDALSRMTVPPAAVYITSPDYLGNLLDIKGIADAAHEFGVPLLVDNAHGAYLHFLETPIHPMDLGADICCDSAHKTLPVLTGGAYLHISKSALLRTSAASPDDTDSISPAMSSDLIENARRAMSIFGSTSPSYLILGSLDLANKMLSEIFDDAIRVCTVRILALKAYLNDIGWPVIGDEPLKITIHASACGYTGYELADILRANKIECEYYDPDYLVLMASPCNTEEDFEKLEHAFESVRIRHHDDDPAYSDDIYGSSSKSPAMFASKVSGNPAMSTNIVSGSQVISTNIVSGNPVMSIREAMFSSSELIPVDEAAGRICCDSGLACPPAIPPVICGEIISPEAICILKYYGISSIRVVLPQ